MTVDVTLAVKVPVLGKLLDYAASGIGGVAGPMLAPWRARRETEAKLIQAQGEAEARQIEAEAHRATLPLIAEAQEAARRQLVAPDAAVLGELTIGDTIQQRVAFQEEKRQRNIAAVVTSAANELSGVDEVPDQEPDHDWTARFFDDVQDVSSEDMQTLWAKVLAGEVERPGSTSIRTLSVLRNLDQSIARLFQDLCSISISVADPTGGKINEARAPFVAGYNDGNGLEKFGVGYNDLMVLNEHGLVIAEPNSWREYVLWLPLHVRHNVPQQAYIPFRYQQRFWILQPSTLASVDNKLRITGAALTTSGMELLRVIEAGDFSEKAQAHDRALRAFFAAENLRMVEVEDGALKTMTEPSG